MVICHLMSCLFAYEILAKASCNSVEKLWVPLRDASKPCVFKLILITNAFVLDPVRAVPDLVY